MPKESPRTRWQIAGGLLALALVAYAPVLLAGFIWDDDQYITANPAMATAGGLIGIWFHPGATPQYYPLTFTSFWMEVRVWGLHAGGYHLVNVLLHGLNAVLLWRMLRYLGLGPAALVAAAIFAVHPVHVESVAWITERKNLLSTLFYLLSARAFFQFLDRTPTQWRLYAASLLLFLAALLSKTVACSLPAAILLVLWWKGRLSWRHVALLTPMIIMGLALSSVTAWMERWKVGAYGHDWDFSFAQRVIIAGRAVWFYAGKLFWPQPLIFVYPRWEVAANQVWQYAGAAGAVAVVVVLWLLRNRIGRGPLVAVLFFLGSLVPALGFVNVYPMLFSFVADHFQYLASIGLITLAAVAIVRLGALACSKEVTIGVTALIVLVLAVLTFARCRVFESDETLWRDTLDKNDHAWMAAYNLALIESRGGNIEEAISLYEQAVAAKPEAAEMHNNLGSAYVKHGEIDKAEQQFRTAIALDPKHAGARRNIAQLLLMRGRLDEALAQANEGVRLQPQWAEGHMVKAAVLSSLGRPDEALDEYREAARLDPENQRAREAISNLTGSGKP